jgi:hypothetical protein
MLTYRFLLSALLALTFAAVPAARAADPTDNPIATYYSGPEGYPAWTDGVNWSRVINMKAYKKGNTEFDRFNNAVKELEGGGVLYYPAGDYDFTKREKKADEGRGLMLGRGVVIRGEAPAGHPVAADGKLELRTIFHFPFRSHGQAGEKVPASWNIIGLGVDDGRNIKTMDHLGIAWVHLTGATVSFGPQFDWGKTWASGNSLLSGTVKKGWDERYGEGTYPIDPLMDGGKKYETGTQGRFVFGCVLEDAAVLDDFSDPGYGPNGFHTSRYCARIIAYGSRVFVANNLLPHSPKGFVYAQKTTAGRGEKGTSHVKFDYGKTIGIDINKELLTYAAQGGTCPGYFEEGVVVRDNYVYNHGHTGYSVSGKWVTIAHNRNERSFLDASDLGRGGVVTLDGWTASTAESDNRSRAFDLAGRNLWVDGNRFNNTGSRPGNDGEGIIGRALNGTPISSWAITHNVHERGDGAAGGLGGLDVDCHGLLVAWNQSPGWVGAAVKSKGVKLADCAFLAGKGEHVVPDEKTVKSLGLQAPLTTSPASVTPPTDVKAETYHDDAVKVSWSGSANGGIGYRVERRIGEGKWQVIAYRPPLLQGDAENPAEWVDFTAPPGRELTYRVVAVNADDTDKGASKPTEPVSLTKPGAQ